MYVANFCCFMVCGQNCNERLLELQWTWSDWHVAPFSWTHCSRHSRRISCILQGLWTSAQKLSAIAVVKFRKMYNVVSCLVGYMRLLTILVTAPQPIQYEVFEELFFWLGGSKNIYLSLQCFFANIILFNCALLEESCAF